MKGREGAMVEEGQKRWSDMALGQSETECDGRGLWKAGQVAGEDKESKDEDEIGGEIGGSERRGKDGS